MSAASPTQMSQAREWAAGIATRLAEAPTLQRTGQVTRAAGIALEALGPAARVGEVCLVARDGEPPLPALVAGFGAGTVVLLPLGRADGIQPGARVTATGHAPRVPVGASLLGRVVDALGQPLDGLGPCIGEAHRPTSAAPPPPLERQRVNEPLHVGVRAIDGLLTCAKGQRIGVFAGSGVGKSSLLGTIARRSSADVNVIALIGERGREVGDFLDKHLHEALGRSVVVVATSDQPPMIRLQAGLAATSIAEHFRDQGRHVLLMMDSLTRLARAQREIGIAVGEPLAAGGYPPSLFALLPELLERAGPGSTGTITGMYTVLVERDDMQDVVADAARATLDGHIVLSRELAHANQYPAIDILASVSRLMEDVVTPDHRAAAAQFRDLMAAHADARDILAVGGYRPGGSPTLDRAVTLMPAMREFLRQGRDELAEPAMTRTRLTRMMPQ